MTELSRLALVRLVAALGFIPSVAEANLVQTNLVSDISGLALETDPNLRNPWGMAYSAMSPFWVSDQASEKSTLYNALGTPVTQSLVVNIPATGAPNGPTGLVFNSTTSDFMIPATGGGTVKASFLFATLDGTIQGWNPGSAAGLNASEPAAPVVPGAVFTGLALGNSGGANYLYAANAAGGITVFDGAFHNVTATTFAGKFIDPNPVSGFTPFNIQRLSNGNLFVTYAAATSTGAPLPGGYVDEYDTAGNFIERIATNGPINAPWGLTIAPNGFGTFGGDLLVGNLFDSRVDAYNLTTTPHLDGSFTIDTGFASPVGLWALGFGNGSTGLADTLYFTSGINDQEDGLFGSINNVTSVPEPGTWAMVLLGFAGLGYAGFKRTRKVRFS